MDRRSFLGSLVAGVVGSRLLPEPAGGPDKPVRVVRYWPTYDPVRIVCVSGWDEIETGASLSGDADGS